MNQLYRTPFRDYIVINQDLHARTLSFPSLSKVDSLDLSMFVDDNNVIPSVKEHGELIAEIPTYLEYIQEHNPEVLL